VITGLWIGVVKGEKGNETHKYRWTDTWMKQTNGGWLCIASQSMEVK
jgi:ketosteroid isomerase-like protein